MSLSIKESLNELGYSIVSSQGDFFRTKALYRGGKTLTSLSVNKKTGKFYDFGNRTSGSWEDFLKLVLGDSPITIQNFLLNDETIIEKPLEKIKYMDFKTYPIEMLEKLIPFYTFYEKKGIDAKIQKLFSCGLATNGLLKNRIVFPIKNLNNQIIGFAGRIINDNPKYPKWLLKGPKRLFCYPLFLNKEIILKQRTVILVESIGDVLALWQAGVYNVLCLFGLSIGTEVLKQLITLNVSKIIISLNNDTDSDENHGQEASMDIVKKLKKYFDVKNIHIIPPPHNDFGDSSTEENVTWYKGLNV